MKSRKIKAWISILLAAAMVIQPAASVRAQETQAAAVATETETNAETRTVELDVIGEIRYENGAGTPKSNDHDTQNLGVWVRKGETFWIHQTNPNFGQDLKMRLRTDDNPTGGSLDIPANGDWVSVVAKEDCVPLLVPKVGTDDNKPRVEFKTAGTEELPVYKKGQKTSEADFYKRWDELDSPYAIYECDYAVLLVPKRDKHGNKFGTLEDMFRYYDGLLTQYNAFAGLTNDANDQPWNRLSGSKYLIKANTHGAGAGYYSGSEVASNGNSISGYLNYNWLINHELGHGYQSFGGVDTGEVWNNIFGYFYQKTWRGENNWLDLRENDSQNGLEFYEEKRATKGYAQSDNFATKLFFWVNMLEKIGPQKSFSYMYRTFRENKYSENGKGNDTSGPDMYAQYLTQGSGYNVAPYFELWKMDISDNVTKMLMQAGTYENVYPLRNLTAGRETANAIKDKLGLERSYSFVTTKEMVKLNETDPDLVPENSVKIKLTEDALTKLADKTIELTDGVRTVQTVEVKTGQNDYTVELPIGVYGLHVPGDGKTCFVYDAYVVVTEGSTIEKNVSVKEVVTDPYDFANFTFIYKGYNNAEYFRAETDMENMKIRLTRHKIKPHESYGSKYSSFEIKDDKGVQTYKGEHYHNDDAQDEEKVQIKPLGVGYQFEVWHQERNEGDVRLRIYCTGNPSYSLRDPQDTKTIYFKVGTNGLYRTSTPAMDEEHQNYPYYYSVCAYMDTLVSKFSQADFKNPDLLIEEKKRIQDAYESDLFPEEKKEAFRQRYQGYFPFESNYTFEIDPVETKYYTGSPIEPELTVKVNGTSLDKTEYTVSWENNTNVGIAKGTIVGKGTYSESVASAVFEIVPNPANKLAVTLEEIVYQYTGGEKLPAATVKCNGTTLEQGVDYQVLYKDNKEIGTASVTVTGMGNYQGATANAAFTIVKSQEPVELFLSDEVFVYYRDNIIIPEVKVFCGGRLLTNGTDYLMMPPSYNEETRNGTITVNVIGNQYNNDQLVKAYTVPERQVSPVKGTPFSNWEMKFGGFSNVIRETIDVNLENGELRLTRINGVMHSSFNNFYLDVGIYDKNSGACFKIERRIGSENIAETTTKSYPVQVGDRIEIYHGEIENSVRAMIYSSTDSSIKYDMTGYGGRGIKTITLEVTELGLRQLSPDLMSEEELKEQYYNQINSYMDSLVEEKVQSNANRSKFELASELTEQKAKLNQGLTLLDESYITRFKTEYPGLYPFDEGHHYVDADGNSSNYGTCTVCGDVHEKEAQAEVTGVTGGYGKIEGTTAAMEYASSNGEGATWQACSDGSTPVGEGTWYVRYKETDDKKAGSAISVTVTKAEWNLSLTGDGTWADAHIGYSSVSAKEFTVGNVGNQTIGEIQVALDGSGKGQFVLSAGNKPSSLAKDGSFTVSVTPAASLQPGNYTATLKVTGSSNTAAEIPLQFKVTDHNYVNRECTICHHILPKEEQTETPKVTAGTGKIEGTTAAMEYASSNGESATWRTCSEGSTSVSEGTWYVRYKETADKKAGKAVSVAVTADVWRVSISGNGTFEKGHTGDFQFPGPRTITVTNTGTKTVNQISVRISGNGADNFELNQGNVKSSLNVGEDFTFTVQPKRGLPVGAYSASIEIVGSNNVKETIPVSFTVTEHRYQNGVCTICGHVKEGTEIIRGDVNNNGTVDLLDLRIMLRYICSKQTLNSSEFAAADMNQDNIVNLIDLRLLLRYICGAI